MTEATDGTEEPTKNSGGQSPPPGQMAAQGGATSVDSPASVETGTTSEASAKTPAAGTDVASTALHEPTGPRTAPVGVERTGMFGVHGSGDTSGFGLLVSAPPGVPRRLHVVYELTSMTYRRRIRLEVAVDVDDPHVPSAVATYPTADWQEREAWDMFGIIFDGHPGLTRILMPDDWDGHPQRKDYPLGGIPVEYKGAEIPAPDTRRSYS